MPQRTLGFTQVWTNLANANSRLQEFLFQKLASGIAGKNPFFTYLTGIAKLRLVVHGLDVPGYAWLSRDYRGAKHIRRVGIFFSIFNLNP